MKITVKQLENLDACPDQVELFEQTFGAEAEVTEGNCLKAAEVELDINWLARRILPAEPLAAYRRAYDEALAAYKRAIAEPWAAFKRAIAEPGADYERARDEASAAYRRARDEAWAAYNRARALAFWAQVEKMEEEK